MYSLIGRYLKKRFCYPISVFLTAVCKYIFLFYVYPTLFSFSRHFVCFEFCSSSGESHTWIRGSLKYYLEEPHISCIFFFVMTITVKKKYHSLRIYSYNKTIDDFGFQLIPRFINPRDLIITSDGLGDNQISGVDTS